ncbi:nucleotide kinase [Ureibacillus aquaedulcis]|uniref:Nucleotide kinase n=1 Tax=Ureibacillus aquaedulcis TaxID=3058421 RepID=A0ABT8GKT6_9BACL|nr:nucleotide kinase [Ureibacillus sp. BA0131]MDN4492027.1 nucleotide kinase [Ureibacillus sp. BA0131]
MSSTVTHFFGQALTGQGIKQLYNEIMSEAKTVYLLKGARGFTVAECLSKLGIHYKSKGLDIEYFHDPLFEDYIEAVFVKDPHNILFLEASNLLIDPIASHVQVVSLEGCLDKQKIVERQEDFLHLSNRKEDSYLKCFQALSNALKIHDDWEVETRRHMDWKGLDAKTDELMQKVFGDRKFEKSGQKTHRLLGTLTPGGARDTVQSITQNLEKRLFIKGYPGTGKSSMMKKLVDVALERGFDAQLVWCGLDSNSVDMVILPELKLCIFDSTEPHQYFPERIGDEIFDIASLCHPTEVEQANIKEIVSNYRSTMNDAMAYAGLYAEAERKVRKLLDDAIIIEKFEEKTADLFWDI